MTSGGEDFRPRVALGASARFVAVGVALSGVYAVTGFGLPCPWRAVTGTRCPLCGATALGGHLLQGDLAGAWAANQFVFVLGCGLALAVLLWTVEALGGPAVRPPRALRRPWLWWTVLGAAAFGFTLWRNLVA